MSRAVTVCLSEFGRLCFVELNRAKVLHAHREGQLMFLVQGEDITCIVNDEPVTLSTDRAVSIDSYSPHEVHVASGSESTIVLSVYINPAWFSARFPFSDPEWLAFGKRSFPITESIRNQLEHLIALVRPPAPDSQPGYQLALDTRMRHLCSACFDRPEDDEVLQRPANPINNCDARIRKSLSIMNNHVRNDLALDDIARAAGLSRPHFYRLFRDNLGVTPNVYMNMLRMEFAVERLIYSDQPVTSIALDLGYASQASFTRFFGANLGIPPTDYRRVASVPARPIPPSDIVGSEEMQVSQTLTTPLSKAALR